ncbi:hypothetical protein Pmani_007764 [Petrolisthes manimaculis]|uniref:NACHT domain-containing protein n=1 Tax=Petrolisthes manimaculis TaxID=1843537 RepID=A0AAE1UJR0_9EUCA|nr:hypothetical protein Pmani_007764 [Petrolisthes manimaculis]
MGGQKGNSSDGRGGGGGRSVVVDSPIPAGLLKECRARVSEGVEGVGRNQCVHGRLVTPLLQGDDGGGGGPRVVEYKQVLTLSRRKDGTEGETGGRENGSEDEEDLRGWVVAGEAGRGKSTLARDVAKSWISGRLPRFQALFIINGYQLAECEIWDVIKSQIPECVCRCGGPVVAEWMEEAPVLIIIDDFIPNLAEAELESALTEWKMASFLLLTVPSEMVECHRLLSSHFPSVQLSLEGLDLTDALHLSSRYLPATQLEHFRIWLTYNGDFCREVMSYGSLILSACDAWKHGFISPTKTTTLTEMIWGLVESRISTSDIASDIRGMETWISVLGKICRRVLETNRLLNKEELEMEAKKLFSSEVLKKVVSSLFPTSTSAASPSVLSFPQSLTQFLAGWDALTQNLRGTPLKALVKLISDEDSIVVYTAGHLIHFLNWEPECKEKQILRVAKNLILHMDRAKDRFGYTCRIMYELKLHPKIMQIISDEVDFPKQWDINSIGILLHPIKYLLHNVKTPHKVLISLEKGYTAPDLSDVVSLFSSAGISMFLSDMNQLNWGSRETSDALLNIIHNGVGKLDDFIGCLSCNTISSLGKFETTRNIVCLRVRVKDVTSIQAVMKCPNELPNLMWLEVDFDLAINEVVGLEVPKVNTPLMDVSFRDMTDEQIPDVCEFLSRLRTRFSGLHLMRSKITPQGAMNLLKYFFRKRMSTSADPTVINTYRLWRFTALAHLPPKQKLTEETAQHLIGYDDRNHYSDNEIRSSVSTTRVTARTLANFFGVLQDVVFFRYVCDNFSVVKNTDGTTTFEELF